MRNGNPDDGELSLLRDELGAQYEFLRFMGRGGLGAIYLARERSLDRLVTIRVLASALADSETSRKRFRREAGRAARLSQPSIVPVSSYGETDSILYYVTGYVDGESL